MRAPAKLVNDVGLLSEAGASSRGSATGPERRLYKRAKLAKSATITELGESGTPGASWECRLVNLSRGGAGLLSRRMVHSGRTIFVMVSLGPRRPGKLLCGVVKQCRYSEGEGYAIGVLFCAPPQAEPIKSWMARQESLPRSPRKGGRSSL